MIRLGCTDAINMDGGGSTALNIRGVLVNSPSDKVERAVVNGVLFYDEGFVPSLAQAEIVPPPGITVGEKVQIQMTVGGEIVPAEEVIWGAQGAGWIDQGGNLRALAVGSVQLSAYARGQYARLQVLVGPAAAPGS
jgi:hypothetical protein